MAPPPTPPDTPPPGTTPPGTTPPGTTPPGTTPPDAEVTDRKKLALTFASDSIKQVLTLSTAILTFTVTFSKDIAKNATDSDLFWLRASWLLLGLAVITGVLALLALTGLLGQPGGLPNIYTASAQIPAAVQMLAFGAALTCTALFGIFAFSGDKPPPAPATASCSIQAPATGECHLP